MQISEAKKEIFKFGSRKEVSTCETILKLLDGNSALDDVGVSGDESCIIITSTFKDGSIRCFIVDPEGTTIETG